MTALSERTRAGWHALAAGALWLGCSTPWLGCSTPELGNTLFSCASDRDCAPGQLCAPFQGQLACQRTPLASESPCPGGSCEPSVSVGTLEPARPAPLEAPESPESVCPEGRCASLPLPQSLVQGNSGALPSAAPEDAGAPGALLDASPDAGLAAPSAPPRDTGPAVPDAGIPRDAGIAPEPPSVRYDFESTLEGWRSVLDQRPDDTLDGTEQTTELAHHGNGALRMIFDGAYTPVPGVSADNGAFYGAYEIGAPPAGAAVSLWMLSTAPEVSVEVYAEVGPSYTWTTLATMALPQNEWREIHLTMPLDAALQFGVQVHAPLELQGFVYLDEIRW